MNSIASAFALSPNVCFLNHGSFGACPIGVLQKQTEFRLELEAEPVQFMVHRLPELLSQARATLARFLGADPNGLAMLPNATSGVNAVLRSLRFDAGDEILITNHGYNACSNAARYVAERAGATVVVAQLPFPILSPDQVIDAVLSTTTKRTRLALLDHVTSPTALVLPIESLAEQLALRGIDVLVDGAHAPGMVPLNLAELDVAYYAGNCHKWLCAPKGSGFLLVREDRQEQIHPPVISHGRNAPLKESSRFRLEFDWLGTTDPTAALCVPTAIEHVGELLPGGWVEIMEHNRKLALAGRTVICETLQFQAAAPKSMLGSLASIPLPTASVEQTVGPFDADPLQASLYDDHRIEAPIFPFPASPHRILRISAHAYNEIGDYERLASALVESFVR